MSTFLIQNSPMGTHIAREKFLSSYMGTHVYYWEKKDFIVLYCINKFQHKLLNDWFTV